MKKRIAGSKWMWILLTVILMLGLGASQVSAAAGIAVVDQANLVPTTLFQSIQYFSPMGQEFTPTLAGLDAIELMTGDFGSEIGVQLQVNVRQDTINGPIIGTSSATDLPHGYFDITHFAFASLVPLKPGRLYVIEVFVVSGGNWGIGSSGGPNSTYPRGNQILLGKAQINNDLWFQEGLANSRPLTKDYCKSDLWKYLVTSDGKSFKSQGACIQYVQTGK